MNSSEVEVKYTRSVEASSAVFSRNQSDCQAPAYFEFWFQAMLCLEFVLDQDSVLAVPGNEHMHCIGTNYGYSVLLNTTQLDERLFIPRQFIAVIDLLQPNRVFIGYELLSRSTLVPIVGGIIYFDENGKQIGQIKLFPRPVIEYDYRNGTPAASNTEYGKQNLLLCDSVLLYCYYHRDYPGINIVGGVMCEDRLVDILQWNRGNYGIPDQVCLGRWLCSRVSNSPGPDKTVCIDLKSMRCEDRSRVAWGGGSRCLVHDEVELLPVDKKISHDEVAAQLSQLMSGDEKETDQAGVGMVVPSILFLSHHVQTVMASSVTAAAAAATPVKRSRKQSKDKVKKQIK